MEEGAVEMDVLAVVAVMGTVMSTHRSDTLHEAFRVSGRGTVCLNLQ